MHDRVTTKIGPQPLQGKVRLPVDLHGQGQAGEQVESHNSRREGAGDHSSLITLDTLWLILQVAADSKSKAMDPKPDASKDPSAGLMDMMKKMYEEGDDEMKRTIAKAWTEGQDKKVRSQVFFISHVSYPYIWIFLGYFLIEIYFTDVSMRYFLNEMIR